MENLEQLLQTLSDAELAQCCDSLSAVESGAEGMYLGDVVQRIRAAVGDEQFYRFVPLVNAECRRRWHRAQRQQ